MLSFVVEPGLELRLLREQHSAELFAVVDKNRAYLRAWLPWVDSNLEVADSREFIMASRLGFADETSLPLSIFLDGKLVGMIGVHHISQNNKSAEIGYWLSEDQTGHGIINKCCRAILKHCYVDLNLNRIVIRAATGNRASRAIPERLGFSLEGVGREIVVQNEAPLDLAIYSLLSAEWQAQNEG